MTAPQIRDLLDTASHSPRGQMSTPGRHGLSSSSWTSLPTENVDEGGQSTGSEAESSYQGWSNQGWRTPVETTNQRESLSSGDEQIHPLTDIPPTSNLGHIPRAISISAHPLSTVSRRQTITRPGFHHAGSTIELASLSPAVYSQPSAILNLGEVTSPAGITSNGFTQPPPYPDVASGHTNTFLRARRKSKSTVVNPLPPQDSEPSPDDEYNFNGMNGMMGGSHGKGKRKIPRAPSVLLPFHRRRRLSNAGWNSWIQWWGGAGTRKPTQPLRRWGIIALAVLSVLYGLILLSRAYELQLEFSFFSHRWIRDEFDVIQPLRGCFDPQHVSPLYDMNRHLAPRHQVLTPGISLKRGAACYDFSSTIQPRLDVPPEPLLYHTYWRSDLIPFGERHTATLASFLATQPLPYSKLVLWTNGGDIVSNNTFVRPFLDKWGDNIEVRQVDMGALTQGTELEGLLGKADGGGLFDERAWVDGDAVRLLVLWHHGGVWMDMDQILTRDLHPLVEHEFVIQWDCFDKPYFPLNGALMHFRQHSPYVCEAFHIMASSPFPRPNTFTWGAHLYAKLHRRLLAGRQRPFTVLPWCFADPRSCRADIRFPDPFGPDPSFWGGRRWDGRGEVGRSGRELLEEKVGFVWTVHLHNQWRKEFPKDGWVDRLLQGYRRQLDAIERSKPVGNGGVEYNDAQQQYYQNLEQVTGGTRGSGEDKSDASDQRVVGGHEAAEAAGRFHARRAIDIETIGLDDEGDYTTI